MAFAKGKTDLDAARARANVAVRQSTLDQAEASVSGRNAALAVNGIAVLAFTALIGTGVYAALPHIQAAVKTGKGVQHMVDTSDDKHVFGQMGGGLAMMGRASGKKSCHEFTAREKIEAEQRNVKRLKNMKKDGSGALSALQFIMPSAQSDMAAISCGTAFGAMMSGRPRHSSGRKMTDAEYRDHRRHKWQQERDLRQRMGLLKK